MYTVPPKATVQRTSNCPLWLLLFKYSKLNISIDPHSCPSCMSHAQEPQVVSGYCISPPSSGIRERFGNTGIRDDGRRQKNRDKVGTQRSLQDPGERTHPLRVDRKVTWGQRLLNSIVNNEQCWPGRGFAACFTMAPLVKPFVTPVLSKCFRNPEELGQVQRCTRGACPSQPSLPLSPARGSCPALEPSPRPWAAAPRG